MYAYVYGYRRRTARPLYRRALADPYSLSRPARAAAVACFPAFALVLLGSLILSAFDEVARAVLRFVLTPQRRHG